MTPWSAGTQLGPYVLVAPIGAGGMGEVWRARDARLDRVVAIKRLNAQHIARFEQEARAIAALNHPHICQIYDIGPDYLVLEFVEGTPLGGPLPVDDAVALAIQIAAAVEEAHAKGITHRDLKPANILRTRAGAKVLDFGLAKLRSAPALDVTQTVEGVVLGTAAYMSPEQAQGQPLDERSDIFSFGAVLYEMLAGDRAFAGNSTAETLSAVLRDDPRPLDAPADLARIVTRCLQRDPAKRFQAMTEVKQALEQLRLKSADAEPSIAVLPFADMSPGKDHEWFSDGIAEEIINLLAHIPGLKVIARTSAFAFKGQQQDIRRIAETLGVARVLEGSVRKAGNRVRVTAQLVAAADGRHLWSERYDREMEDVFAVQDDIAAAIAKVLHATLVTTAVRSRHHTPSLPAYEAVLRGRHFISKMTPDAMARALELYEQAIASDPGYALPHFELGWCWHMLALFGLQPARLAMPLAREAALRALAIDPSLLDAHGVVATVAAVYDYDWNEAERQFRLMQSQPVISPRARVWHSSYLCIVGRMQEAVAEAEGAVAADPLNPLPRVGLGVARWYSGRVEDAMEECRRILELDERQYLARYNLGMMHYGKGDLLQAIALQEETCAIAPWNPVARGALAGLLRRSGDARRADEELKKLGDGSLYHTEIGLMFYHLVCSEIDQAADWAEKAVELREPGLLVLLGQPVAKALRSSSRWPALARMMNLPASAG